MVGPIGKMVNAVTGGSPAYANSPRPATPLLRSHRNLRTPRPFRPQGTQASANNGHNGNGSNTENPISQAAEKVVDGVKTVAGHAANKMAPAGMRPAREGGNDPYTDMPSSEQDTAFWTLNTGAPVYDNDHSLKVGPRGPILLEDYQLLEKLANFDRERIPERVVHARGATAKGHFEVTHDITNLTCAEVFSRVGHKTPVLARFSTVIHSRDAPETLRDVRGFSVKFYTKEGNWDFVGNDIPVFFIRDGMKFPDLVHALKPNPRTNIQEPWRILDFLSHFPESTHILTWLQDDAGIPKDYRHMPGFGVHTWKLVNKEGRETFVKFHFKTRQGEEFLLKEEAAKVAAENHSHATKDLFDSIERGDFPKWDLYIQTMEQEDEQKFEFDPLDNTKIWPEEQFPLQPVGTLVLDTNIDNFFAENESVAFAPSSLVPGIAPSDDPLLQTRLFSYSDTQRYRLGPNYLQLPANAPKTAYHNNHYDGLGNFMIRKEEVNYWPSRHLGEGKHPAVMSDKHPEPKAHDLDGGKPVRSDLPRVHDDFKQGGDRYRSLDSARQERMVERFATWMSHPRVQEDVRDIWYGYFTKMDAGLGEKVRAMTTSMIESKPAEARAAKPAGPPES